MAEMSPKIVFPALLVVALGAAFLAMPSADLGPEIGDGVAPPPVAPKTAAMPAPSAGTQAPDGWVAAEPPSKEAAQALAERRSSQDWRSARERIKGMERIQNDNAARAGAARLEILDRRAEMHLSSQGQVAQDIVGEWLDKAELPNASPEAVQNTVDKMADDLEDIRLDLTSGRIDAQTAIERAEEVQTRAMKEVAHAADGELPPEVEKAFAAPRVPKAPPTPNPNAIVPPDGWWEGEPLNWE
jgi:hypothetical protein